MLWDFYPEYLASAPVRATGWNHVRLVISGQRMNVYINHQLAPCLRVGELEGDTLAGGHLPAGAGAIRQPGADLRCRRRTPAVSDPGSVREGSGLIRHWLVSPPYTLPANHAVTIADMPSAADAWKPLAAERGGAINLSRRYGSPAPVPAASVVWLKTTIDSSGERDEQVAIGWLRAVWVFANGKPVFAGKNYYYTVAEASRRPNIGSCEAMGICPSCSARPTTFSASA